MTVSFSVSQWYGPPLGGDSIVRFYRSFKCTHGSEERSYSLGDLCWIKSSRDAAVCLLQIHTLWQKLSNARMFAGGRLFFRPEDTPKGRHPEHGQVGRATPLCVLVMSLLSRLYVRNWAPGLRQSNCFVHVSCSTRSIS